MILGTIRLKVGNLSIKEILDNAGKFVQKFAVVGPSGVPIKTFGTLHEAKKFAEEIHKRAEAARNDSRQRVVDDFPEYAEAFQELEEEEKNQMARGITQAELIQAMKDFRERIATDIENGEETSLRQKELNKEEEEELERDRGMEL